MAAIVTVKVMGVTALERVTVSQGSDERTVTGTGGPLLVIVMLAGAGELTVKVS